MPHALLTLLLAAAPDIEQAPETSPPAWEIYASLAGGWRPDERTVGGVGALGVNRRFGTWFRPELVLGTGAYPSPGEMVIVIRIGARLELPLEGRLKPYLW